MFKLINAAMVPNEGIFQYRLITRDQASQWLGANLSECLSTHGDFIGHQQTADHLDSLFSEYCSTRGGQPRIKVPLRRVKCSMQPGDEALVCKLAYRVENPATKGQPQEEDWEYGVLTFVVPSFGYASLEKRLQDAADDATAPIKRPKLVKMIRDAIAVRRRKV